MVLFSDYFYDWLLHVQKANELIYLEKSESQFLLSYITYMALTNCGQSSIDLTQDWWLSIGGIRGFLDLMEWWNPAYHYIYSSVNFADLVLKQDLPSLLNDFYFGSNDYRKFNINSIPLGYAEDSYGLTFIDFSSVIDLKSMKGKGLFL